MAHSFPTPRQNSGASTDQGNANQETHPWRRFFARIFDCFLIQLSIILMVFLFALYFPNQSKLINTFSVFVGFFFILIFSEAFFISNFGTTPGKWIFGISVSQPGGQNLSYWQALNRSARVAFHGMALGLPILSFLAALIAYQKLTNEGATSWDGAVNARVNHEKWGTARTLFCISASLLAILGMNLLSVLPKILENYQRRNPPSSNAHTFNSEKSITQSKQEEPISRKDIADSNAKKQPEWRPMFVAVNQAPLYEFVGSVQAFHSLPMGTQIQAHFTSESRVGVLIQDQAGNHRTVFMNAADLSTTAPAHKQQQTTTHKSLGSIPISDLMTVEVIRTEGIDTSGAAMTGEMTHNHAEAYCQKISNDFGENKICLSDVLFRSSGKYYRARADCNLGEIETTSLENYTLQIDHGTRIWTNAETREILDDTQEPHQRKLIEAQYNFLCPTSFVHGPAREEVIHVFLSPSFDCAAAFSWDEQAICSDAELAGMDRKMDALYKQLLSDETHSDEIRAGQRLWLMQRKSIRNRNELADFYDNRIKYMLSKLRTY